MSNVIYVSDIPWTITENTNRTKNGVWFEIDAGPIRIAEIPASTAPMWDSVCGYQSALKNAKLIASSRKLLSALKELAAEEWRDDDDPILENARIKARNAIAEAEGV